MYSWHFFMLPAMSGWVALLEADAVHVGQWMFSRPLLIGPMMGLVCGNVAVGISFGILFELLSQESLPVGSVMPVNVSIGAGCGVLLAAGPDAVALAAAFPASLGLGVGHRWCESRIRQWRGNLGLRILKSVQEEGRIDWEGILLRGLGPHILMTALFVYLSVAVLGPLLAWLWSAVPVFVRSGFEFGLQSALGIGLATMICALMRKR